MKTASREKKDRMLMLKAGTAADLMTGNPVSIRDNATVKEAAGFLTDRGFSAAPVIDRAGVPVGVLSRADIIDHDRGKDEFEPDSMAVGHTGENLKTGFQVVKVDRTLVKDIMTPTVFSVNVDTPVVKVINELLDLKVHRLFVVSKDGTLVGVISTMDVLRHLLPAENGHW